MVSTIVNCVAYLLIILHLNILYVKTTHCKCGVFLPKWDNKKHGGCMFYYDQTIFSQLSKYISDKFKEQICVSICESLSNFCNTLVTVGYSLANKSQDNKTAANNLCAAAEVVYNGFKGGNAAMKEYQDNTLKYSNDSLMLTIFSNLIRGVHVLEDEEKSYNLDHSIILGNICDTYAEHHDLCIYLKSGC